MDSNSKVNDFLAKLSAQNATMSKKVDFKAKSRVIEKISLNFEGNFGRYQILPLDSVVTDYPFVNLKGTAEVCVPRKMKAADGTEAVISSWIRLLPENGYQMKDATGRVTSSLTSEEEQLLRDARSLFSQLYDELDYRNNSKQYSGFIRRRNYTIFNGYCLNKWKLEDSRSPERCNFSGLFVCTASGFTQAVEDNLTEYSAMNAGDMSVINDVYGRQLTGRRGFMMFSISRSKTAAGYNVTVNHVGGDRGGISSVVIPEDDAALMVDPVAQFLGWQARKDDDAPDGQKRLFNAPLIKSTIQYMTQQLAAIRMAKQNGTSLEEAVKITNEAALANSEPLELRKTNDPMLNEQQAGQAAGSGINRELIEANNDDPLHTPPVSHVDPITNSPVSTNSAPFSGYGSFGMGNPQPTQPAPQQSPFVGGGSPSFAGFGAAPGSDNNDLPF